MSFKVFFLFLLCCSGITALVVNINVNVTEVIACLLITLGNAEWSYFWVSTC